MTASSRSEQRRVANLLVDQTQLLADAGSQIANLNALLPEAETTGVVPRLMALTDLARRYRWDDAADVLQQALQFVVEDDT